jgi:hypothetical protein
VAPRDGADARVLRAGLNLSCEPEGFRFPERACFASGRSGSQAESYA